MLFVALRRDLLLAPIKFRSPLGIIPTENGPAVVGQVKPHLGKQLFKGNFLPFEEPQHPLLCHQKIDQVSLDALRVIHIVDILIPGAGVANKPVVKLGHPTLVPVQLSDETIVHTVDTDGLGQTLLGADEDGVVVVLKV